MVSAVGCNHKGLSLSSKSIEHTQSKGNQTMRFGQFIAYNKRNIFLQKLCRNWDGENSFRPFYIFKKLNMRWKQVICNSVSIYFDATQLAIQWKQTLD